MEILALNCNTSAAMTRDITANAQRAARPGTHITGARPDWGPQSAEGFYDSFITAAAGLDKVKRTDMTRYDGLIMAGFGEHGREGMRQLLTIPVVDITEAGVITACLVGHRFGIVTTTTAAVGQIDDALLAIGLRGRCAGIRATRLPVLDAADHDGGNASHVLDAIAGEARALAEAGADVIVLGCAGFSGLDEELERRLGMPVIDPVAAAVAQCEALISLGKRTSKAGPYAEPNTNKEYPGWPVEVTPDRS